MDNGNNLFWHDQSVSDDDRRTLKGHDAMVLWFTGLSASGKSSIANAVDAELNKMGVHTYLLDGDNIRQGLNKNLGFSTEDRTENIRRIGEVSKLMVNAGLITLTAFISPFQADRNMVRALFSKGQFVEIACEANLETCESRDTKGLYNRARRGEIPDFTGISSPYEKPINPELTLDSETKDIATLCKEVLDFLEQRCSISPRQ